MHIYCQYYIILYDIIKRFLYFQLLLNAEGTRFTPAKHAASQKFAAEHGLPVLKHHLTPRTKGFIASLPSLKAKCPAIYDIQLVVKPDEKVPNPIINLLQIYSTILYIYAYINVKLYLI